jgi:hypothetical protein
MPIIKTIAELTTYVEANALTDISVIMPSIRTAERRHLVPVLGDAQYAELLNAYNDTVDTISDDEQNLIDLSQEAVANIAMAVAVTRLSVVISESGVRRSESDSQKTAYQYQERNARDSFSQAGFDALEDLLAFLDSKRNVFTAWAASPAYQEYRSYFIPSAIEFSKYYAIKQSRLVYLTIAPIIRNVENFILRDVIGKPLFDALKTAQKADTLSDNYKTLLTDYICPGIALHTIAKGMMQYSLDLTENGVSINLVGRTINIETKEQALLDKFQAIITQLTTDANRIFYKLAEELTANPDLYPDYVVPAQQASQMTIINTTDKSFYGV